MPPDALRCFRCLYDLRAAAAPDSVCPECGLPVATSRASWAHEHDPRFLARFTFAILATAGEYAALVALIALESTGGAARLTDALLVPPMAICGVLGGWWTARAAGVAGRESARRLVLLATAAVAVPYAITVVTTSYTLIDPSASGRFAHTVVRVLFLLNVAKAAAQFAAISARAARLPGPGHGGRGAAVGATAATLVWAIGAAIGVVPFPARLMFPMMLTAGAAATVAAAFLLYAAVRVRSLAARTSP